MAQDFLSKVRSLSESADSFEANGQTEVAATYRAKAEELMRTYRITQEEALARDTISIDPVLSVVDLCPVITPYRQQYINIMWYMAEHTGCKIVFDFLRPEGRCTSDQYRVVAKVVGYEMDVEYAEMLFTAARLVFAERMEPSVKPELGDQVNAYRLRAAGIERVRASEMLWGTRDPGKVGRLYLKECKERGETPALVGRGVTGKVYREQYADEFVYVLSRRLQAARNAADNVGGGLVLHGRKERVQEAFYTHFPHMRPSTEAAVYESAEPCEKCQPGKLCRSHQAAENAYQRDAEKRRRTYHSAAAQAGRASGAAAATYVDLGPKATAKRVDGGNGTANTKELQS